MANSIELRVPLLDHNVLEFTAKLPLEYKIKKLETKYIFKKILKNEIPKKLLKERNKDFLHHIING
jgi:asparagine synthase (glutamine-hydrolysing)